MKKKLSVIVPCFNEEENIQPLVQRIQKIFQDNKIPGEIILINDGSTDNTQVIINKCKKKFKNLRETSHNKNKGIASSWKTGLKLARSELVLTIDADLQYQPEDISRLYNTITTPNLINKECIVQGYRIVQNKRYNSRFLLSKTLNQILNLLFRMKLKDNKSGFIMCKKEIFQDILNYKFKYNYFQHFLLVSANKKGYKIAQIPVMFAERKFGKSFLKNFPLKFIFNTIRDLPKAYLEFRK